MKKKIILGILLVILLAGVGFGGYFIGTMHSSKPVEEPKDKVDNKEPEVKESNDSIVISNTSDLIYELNEKYEVLWSYKVKEVSNYYNISRVDGDYIYFTDNDMLYRRNYVTGEVENLEIELKDYWNFHVSGDYLIYDVLFDIYQVNLKTKEQTKLTVQGENEEALINGVLYYTSKEDSSISSYNLETKEIIKLEDEGRIEEYNSEYILYVTGNDTYVLYSVEDGSKQKILQEDFAHSSGLNYPIHMYDGKVYTMEKDTLEMIGETNTNVYKREVKEKETIQDFIFLSENKVLLSIFVESSDSECQADICGPEGEFVYYVVDLNTKEEKEITEYIDVFDVDYEFYHINK